MVSQDVLRGTPAGLQLVARPRENGGVGMCRVEGDRVSEGSLDYVTRRAKRRRGGRNRVPPLGMTVRGAPAKFCRADGVEMAHPAKIAGRGCTLCRTNTRGFSNGGRGENKASAFNVGLHETRARCGTSLAFYEKRLCRRTARVLRGPADEALE